MLYCVPYKKKNVIKAERREDALWLTLSNGLQKLVPVSDGIVRVLYTEKEMFSGEEKPGVVASAPFEDWTYEEREDVILLRMKELLVEIDKESNRFRYYDAEGSLLLSERDARSKELQEFPVYRMDETVMEKTYVDTPDGRKEVVRDAAKIQVGTAYHTRLNLEFGDEALYGLGQREEGLGSLRGKRVYLHQANRRIAVPMLVSTKGYGLLVNTYAPAIFNDTEEGTYLYSEADPEMDFFFISGRKCSKDQDGGNAGEENGTSYAEWGGSPMDEVIRGYRRITGKAALLPKWAFGYFQSQERYESQEEILRIAREYRERGIGLDCIVLDWCSWPEGQWGQKTFDPVHFPDATGMIEKLHAEHVHFMLSIWPNLTEGTENYEEFKKKGLLLPGINNYDPLSPEGRRTYWQQVERGLFCHGVDAWWCDNSEPFTPEWNSLVRPENTKTYDEYCRVTAMHLPETKTNAYGFYHAQGIYEGQREYYKRTASVGEKRVVNLTRSGYLGQQRFGTILWSGDVSASWETLRNQIAAGLHFCASGLPYWTVDIGAFFVKNGLQWFWDGQYDQGPKDPAYCELFTRWYQWGAFLPIFRGHGTDFRRELWEFDRPEAPFCEALIKANKLRYELMPYIYSLAGLAWLEDASIIKPLAFGFSEDQTTWNVSDQYLFGDNLMICPVTESYFFKEPDSFIGKTVDVEGVPHLRRTYLPAGTGWYDYWTNEYYEGGQWIMADAPLDQIPIFVKAGTILPKKEFALSVEEQPDEISLTVYAGADGEFVLYEDAGDGYAYEEGEYQLTRYQWFDADHKLLKDGRESTGERIRVVLND